MFSSRKPQVIDPAALNADTNKLLASLLEQHPEKAFFDIVDAKGKKPQTFKVSVKNAKNTHTTYQVSLAKPLVKFTSKHHPETPHYAVCEVAPFGAGSEGAVYASKATITQIKREDGSVSVLYKEKSDEKARAIKKFTRSNQKQKNNLVIARSPDEKAAKEAAFLQTMSLFHVKNPVFSNDNQQAAVVMRHIQGKSLLSYLLEDHIAPNADGDYISDKQTIFSIDERIELTLQVGRAILDQVHANGITHRDIKPEHLLVNASFSVTVLDFGLSKWNHDVCSAENSGTSVYQAPEAKLTKGAWTNAKSDSYSYAKILMDYLWNDIYKSPKFYGLAFEDKKKIQQVIATATHDDPASRATLQDILNTFGAIKASRAPACDQPTASASMNARVM